MLVETREYKQYFTEVNRLYFEEGVPVARMASQLPASQPTIYRWIAIFGAACAAPSAESQPDASPSLTAIAQLKVALQEACMARDAYRATIDYAEENEGLPYEEKLPPSSDTSACGHRHILPRVGTLQTTWL